MKQVKRRISTRKRINEAQRKIMQAMHDANGRVVQVKNVRSAMALVRRGWIVRTATGFKLRASRIERPTWCVEASFRGVNWTLRDALKKAVRGADGSGFDFIRRRSDVTWTVRTEEKAREIAVRLEKLFTCPTCAIKVKVHSPKPLRTRVGR